MPTLKQEYRYFLKNHFEGLRLRKPLFYSWKIGLRFDLQHEEFESDDYYNEVVRRASTIFQAAFDNSDKVFLVFMDYRYKRNKIRLSNFVFKQINDLKKSEISYSKELRLYEPGDKFDIRNIAISKVTVDRINFKNILSAISHMDDSSRKPRLDNRGSFTGIEIYFINIDKKLIFHMYDDRGLDLISSEKQALLPIYKDYNDLILEHDREQIDKLFE